MPTSQSLTNEEDIRQRVSEFHDDRVKNIADKCCIKKNERGMLVVHLIPRESMNTCRELDASALQRALQTIPLLNDVGGGSY